MLEALLRTTEWGDNIHYGGLKENGRQQSKNTLAYFLNEVFFCIIYNLLRSENTCLAFSQ